MWVQHTAEGETWSTPRPDGVLQSLQWCLCEQPEECSSRIVLFGCLKDKEVQMVSTRIVTCFEGLTQKCLLCPCRSRANVCASVVKRIPARRLCDDVFSHELNIANNTSFSSHQRVSEGEEPRETSASCPCAAFQTQTHVSCFYLPPPLQIVWTKHRNLLTDRNEVMEMCLSTRFNTSGQKSSFQVVRGQNELLSLISRNEKQEKRFFPYAEKVTPSGTEVSGLYSSAMIPFLDFLGEMIHSRQI